MDCHQGRGGGLLGANGGVQVALQLGLIGQPAQPFHGLGQGGMEISGADLRHQLGRRGCHIPAGGASIDAVPLRKLADGSRARQAIGQQHSCRINPPPEIGGAAAVAAHRYRGGLPLNERPMASVIGPQLPAQFKRAPGHRVIDDGGVHVIPVLKAVALTLEGLDD